MISQSLIVKHLKKVINLFYKNHYNKLIIIFFVINTKSLIVRLIIQPIIIIIKFGK